MLKKSDVSQTEDVSTDSCGKIDGNRNEEDKKYKSSSFLLKYSDVRDTFYIIDSISKKVLNKMTTSTHKGLSRMSPRFSSLNIYEKEIIVWLKLNHIYYIDNMDLISELMLRFNISETKSSYLIDHAGV